MIMAWFNRQAKSAKIALRLSRHDCRVSPAPSPPCCLGVFGGGAFHALHEQILSVLNDYII
jgi:hypothetical protein